MARRPRRRAALAHHFGVSRKTAQVHQRFRAAGADDNLDRIAGSPRARPYTATMPQEVVDLLVQAKRADVALGPKKLVPLGKSESAYPHLRPLARDRVSANLDGPVTRRRRRRRQHGPW